MQDSTEPTDMRRGIGSNRSAKDRPEFGRTTQIATYSAFLLIFVLLSFAALAPISGGALATGTINPEGSRRIVQHFEGGIIAEILVRDGDVVEEGDPLIVLDSTRAASERNISRARLETLMIIETRLNAEMRTDRSMDLSSIDFSIDPRLMDTARSETEILERSHDLVQAQSQIDLERKNRLRLEIEGLKAAIASLNSQLDLLGEEIAAAQILVEKELYAVPRLLQLQREEAALNGQILTHESNIFQIEGQIREIDGQRSEALAIRRSEIAQQISDIRQERVQSQEVLETTEDTLMRTVVRSPISGTVVALRYKTLGGVVGPGDPIIDIVPSSEELIIEAQISPADVDVISPGQIAQVTFSTLRRDLPQIDGYVKTISADALVDERTGIPYFKAEITVPRKTLDLLGLSDELTPGIPVDIIIVTESRTILNYLLQPLRRSMRRAFKETD